MIAIPNMKKPKNCYECPIAKSYLDCLMEKKYVCPIGNKDGCPIIEIDEKAFNEVIKGYLEGLKAIQNGERRSDGNNT